MISLEAASGPASVTSLVTEVLSIEAVLSLGRQHIPRASSIFIHFLPRPFLTLSIYD